MASVQTIKATYSSAAVNTSASTVLANNPERRFLLLQNVGSVDVYFRFGETATADTDSFILKADGFGILFQDQVVEGQYISAITASSTSKVLVGEY
jgi:hypothetical protein